MSRRDPGRLRTKLAALLCAALPDVDVRPEDLVEAQGFYRTSNHILNEAYRWECFTRLRGSDVPVVFGSFSTMTSCVRYGVSVSRGHNGRRGQLDIDVESKGPPPAAKGHAHANR